MYQLVMGVTLKKKLSMSKQPTVIKTIPDSFIG
jgi:hypothetical protein